MNLIQFKQVQGLSSALAQNTSYATAISGYLDGEIWTIMTGDSTFTGQKTFVGDVVFDNVVTGRSSGNFLGGLWVDTDKVLTQADTGTLFVTTVNSQNITGTKTFQGQGSSDNVIFKGGKVTIRKWGSVGETSPELGVSGSLFITGSDGAPFQITRNSPWLNASSDPANGDLYYSGTPTSVLPAQVGIGVIPSHMLDVDGVGNFKSVLADGISGHTLSGKTGFLEELQVGTGLDNYWNSESLVSPFISSTSGNFSSALTLGGQSIVTGSAGGSTAWSNGSSSDIYYNGGNVGIGTGVPATKLHVVGDGQVLQHEDGALAVFAFPGIGGDVRASQFRLIDSSGDVGLNFISSDKYVFSGGNVGIETDTPTTALDIHGTISLNSQGASSRGLWFGSGTQALGYVGPQNYAVNGLTTGDFGISSAKNDHVFTGSLAFGIGGTERMRIDSLGNVGIGTDDPTAKLTIGDGTESTWIKLDGADGSYQIGASSITGPEKYFSIYDTDASGHRLFISESGNVGIGTSTPSAKLSLPTNGGDPIAATPSDGIMMGNALNTYGLNLWHNNSGNTITYFDSVYDSDNSLIQFRGKCVEAAIPVEAMAIKGNGNVGIGITGAEAKLHVTGGKILAPSGDFSESLTISGQPVLTGSSSSSSLWNNGSGSAIYYNDGNVGIGTAAPNGPLEVLKGGTGHVDQLFLTNNHGASGDSAGLVFTQAPATHHYAGIRGIFTDILAATEDAELAFYTSEAGTYAEKVRIDSAGNLGIGTDDPASKLDVDGTISTAGSFTSVVATGYNAHFSRSDKAPALIFHGMNSSDSLNWTMGISAVDGNNNKLSIKRVDDADGFTAEPFTILSNDNVGIGTDDPQAKLQVTGGKILAPSGDFTESLTISGQPVLTESSPGGSNTEVQFNDGGSFGASPNLAWGGTRLELGFGQPATLPAEDPAKLLVSGVVRILDSYPSTSDDEITIVPGRSPAGGDNFAIRTGGSVYFSAGPSYGAQVSGNNLTQQVSAPASASSAGSPGQTSYDSSYFYVCVSADTWKRAALNTW